MFSAILDYFRKRFHHHNYIVLPNVFPTPSSVDEEMEAGNFKIKGVFIIYVMNGGPENLAAESYICTLLMEPKSLRDQSEFMTRGNGVFRGEVVHYRPRGPKTPHPPSS